jgi:hypothetical protein
MSRALSHYSWACWRHSNFMETQLNYDEAVARERDAWHDLHSHPPGTPERERAWEAWSQAIVQTNHAWRKLSARRAIGVQHHAGA